MRRSKTPPEGNGDAQLAVLAIDVSALGPFGLRAREPVGDELFDLGLACLDHRGLDLAIQPNFATASVAAKNVCIIGRVCLVDGESGAALLAIEGDSV